MRQSQEFSVIRAPEIERASSMKGALIWNPFMVMKIRDTSYCNFLTNLKYLL